MLLPSLLLSLFSLATVFFLLLLFFYVVAGDYFVVAAVAAAVDNVAPFVVGTAVLSILLLLMFLSCWRSCRC